MLDPLTLLLAVYALILDFNFHDLRFLIIVILFGWLLLLLAQMLWTGVYWYFGRRGKLLRLRWASKASLDVLQNRRMRRASEQVVKAYGLTLSDTDDIESGKLSILFHDLAAMNMAVPNQIFSPLGRMQAIAALFGGARHGLPPTDAYIRMLGKVRVAPLKPGPILAMRRLMNRSLGFLAFPFHRSQIASAAVAGQFFDMLSALNPEDPAARLASKTLPDTTVGKLMKEQCAIEGLDPVEKQSFLELGLSHQRRIVAIWRALTCGTLGWWWTVVMNLSMFRMLSRYRAMGRTNQRARRDQERRAADIAALPDPSQRGALDADEIERVLDDNATPAILLRRLWPVGAEATGASWLGGWPCLPAGIEWPRHGRTNMPLHFLAQIDCEDLPRMEAETSLPDDGRLLFFADLDEEMLMEDDGSRTPDSSRVIYVPKPEGTDTLCPWPEDMPDIDHPRSRKTGPDAQIGRRGFEPWPITAHSFTTWPVPEYAPRAEIGNPDYKAEAAARHNAEINRLLGVEENTSDDGSKRPERPKFIRKEVCRDPATEKPVTDTEGKPQFQIVFDPDELGANFPWCSDFVVSFVNAFQEQVRSAVSRAATAQDYARDETSRKRTAANLRNMMAAQERAEEIVEALGEMPSAAPLPVGLRESFSAWIQNMLDAYPLLQNTLHYQLRKAGLGVVQRAITDEDLLPFVDDDLIALNADWLRLDVSKSEHVMLGFTQFKTNSTQGKGVRLLLLDSDYGPGFMFCDAGVIEYWIDPEDLAASRFERAYALTAGG